MLIDILLKILKKMIYIQKIINYLKKYLQQKEIHFFLSKLQIFFFLVEMGSKTEQENQTKKKWTEKKVIKN